VARPNDDEVNKEFTVLKKKHRQSRWPAKCNFLKTASLEYESAELSLKQSVPLRE
jgi:hypothetical protein